MKGIFNNNYKKLFAAVHMSDQGKFGSNKKIWQELQKHKANDARMQRELSMTSFIRSGIFSFNMFFLASSCGMDSGFFDDFSATTSKYLPKF